jgi:hypothetical protein
MRSELNDNEDFPEADPMSPYEQAFNRIRAEFTEMPGMRLTPEQVERLSGVGSSVCRLVLDDLVRAGFLSLGANGRYARSTDLDRVLPRSRALESSQRPTVGIPVPTR